MKNIPKRTKGTFRSTQEKLDREYYDNGAHQADLSELSGIAQGHISKIINNKAGFIDDKIAEVHNILMDNIIPNKNEAIQGTVLRAKRESLKCSKISFKDAQEIRRLYFTGNYTQVSLSKAYNLHQSTIHRILVGKKWKEIM